MYIYIYAVLYIYICSDIHIYIYIYGALFVHKIYMYIYYIDTDGVIWVYIHIYVYLYIYIYIGRFACGVYIHMYIFSLRVIALSQCRKRARATRLQRRRHRSIMEDRSLQCIYSFPMKCLDSKTNRSKGKHEIEWQICTKSSQTARSCSGWLQKTTATREEWELIYKKNIEKNISIDIKHAL